MKRTTTRPSEALKLESLEQRDTPAPFAYAVQSDGDDRLYLLDMSTGAATPIGPVGFADVEGIAFDPTTNILYGIDDLTKQLITINTTTGAGTVVGPLGLPPGDINAGLRFDSAGNLYMSTDFAGNFYSINKTTGAATLIGPQGIPIYGLAYRAGTMFGLGNNSLATVNLGTGAATVVGPLLTVNATQGDIDNDPATNTLWGITDGEHGPPVTFTVNPSTGQATVVASTLTGFESLAFPFVPPGPPPVPPPPVPPNAQGVVVVGANAGAQPNVSIFDANTGTAIFGFLAYDASMSGGVNVAVGDVTGDGIAEIITAPASIGGSDVRVFDFAGNLLFNFLAYPGFYGGVSVAVGDVNGDGIGDIITGAGRGGGPHVRVFQGGTFQPIIDFLAYDSQMREGIGVATADFNSNGRADIITGPGPGGGADVRIFTDGQHNQMQAFLVSSPLYRGGISVAGGNVLGNGTPELILASMEGPPFVTVNQIGNGTLNRYRTFKPYGNFPGGARVGIVNLTSGSTVISTGAGPGGGPHVRLIDANIPNPILDFLAFDANFNGGVNVSST